MIIESLRSLFTHDLNRLESEIEAYQYVENREEYQQFHRQPLSPF